MTYEICEGVAGVYRYHLCVEGSPAESLCGKQTMMTHARLESWGFRSHLAERYCSECENLAGIKSEK